MPESNFFQGARFLLLFISLIFIVINLYLFFQPRILYGLEWPDMKVSAKTIEPRLRTTNEQEENTLSSEIAAAGTNLEYYKPILERYIHNQKPFLKQGYSISDLSSETGIPQHHLSALLNRIYELRFTDFLNRMRINYIRENFHHSEWHQLTLEGIARQAGFNSRTTFFNAIKKATGLTPSEFMAEIKADVSLPQESKVH